jgi:hypothetical protein
MELNKHVSIERMKNRLKDNENFKLVREVVDTDDIILTVAEMKLDNGVDIVFIDNEGAVIQVESVEAHDPDPVVCDEPY